MRFAWWDWIVNLAQEGYRAFIAIKDAPSQLLNKSQCARVGYATSFLECFVLHWAGKQTE